MQLFESSASPAERLHALWTLDGLRKLDPKLVEKIKEAFFKFPWEGSALQAEFQKEGKFVPIDYKKDWAVLRKIDEATGVKYTCK